MSQFEQVCRYRKDTGYGISAKTSGITPEQEEMLGEVFNDSMNSLFPKVGTSFLTCINGGSNLFYAKNTLLTDAHGRISLFTHSYVLGAEEYADLMTAGQWGLLDVPMSALLDSPGGSFSGQPVRVQDDAKDDGALAELMQKYKLTPKRYADLLYGVYHAILNHQPLRLVTSRTFEEREQVVRELVQCIMPSLLPQMRPLLTFSSGPDWRTSLSVIPADQVERIDREDMMFGVEDDSCTNVRITDMFRGAFFNAVADTTGPARAEILKKVETWIDQELMQSIPASVMVLATAYTAVFAERNPENLLYIFCGLKSCAGQSIALGIADEHMIRILKELRSIGGVGAALISHMAEWYLRQSSDDYRNLADEILRDSLKPRMGVSLISAALKTKNTEQKAQLIRVLLETATLDHKSWTDADKKKLFFWIIATNQAALLGYVDEIMPIFDGQLPQTMEKLLRDAKDHQLNAAQNGVLCSLLERIMDDELLLSDDAWKSLNSHVREWDTQTDPEDRACKLHVRYLIVKRLDRATPVVEQARFLLKYAAISEYYCKWLEKQLENVSAHVAKAYLNRPGFSQKENKKRLQDEIRRAENDEIHPCVLWEYYTAEKWMGPDVKPEQIPEICEKHNDFRYGGYFEQKAVGLLGDSAKLELLRAAEKGSPGGQNTSLQDAVRRWIKEAEKIGLSADMRNKIKEIVIITYWENVEIRDIFRYVMRRDNDISRVTQDVGDERSRAKEDLQVSVNAYRVTCMKSFSRSSERGPKAEQAKIESTINLCSAINRIRTVDRRTAEPVYQGLKDLLGKHVAQHLKLPADLVLMCCMGHDHADLVDKETCRKVYLLLEELQGSIDAETRNGQNEVKKIEKEIEQKAELERRLLEERRQSAASASGRKSDKQMQSQPSIDAEIKKVRNEKSKLENDAEWLRGELTELVEIKVKVKGSALLDNRKEDVRKRNRAFAKELSSCAGRLSKPPRLVELLIAELRQGRYEKRRPE